MATTRLIATKGIKALIANLIAGGENLIISPAWRSILFGVNVPDGSGWTLKNLTANETFVFYIFQEATLVEDPIIYTYAGAIKTFLTSQTGKSLITNAAIDAGAAIQSINYTVRALGFKPYIRQI